MKPIGKCQPWIRVTGLFRLQLFATSARSGLEVAGKVGQERAPSLISAGTKRSCGREAEGGGLLNRYRVVKPYRGFESLRLRQFTFPARPTTSRNPSKPNKNGHIMLRAVQGRFPAARPAGGTFGGICEIRQRKNAPMPLTDTVCKNAGSRPRLYLQSRVVASTAARQRHGFPCRTHFPAKPAPHEGVLGHAPTTGQVLSRHCRGRTGCRSD